MFKQAIVVEFEAEISRIPKEHWDDPKYIVLDYAIASKILKEYLESKPFRLIETAADGVADLLMKSFPIISLKVSVTKRPKDMPQGSSVTYICQREKNNHEGY